MEQVIKILQEIRKKLSNSFMCGVGIDQKEAQAVGEYLLNKCQELSTHYNSDNYLLKDLQEKATKIKQNEVPGYNKELAIFICSKLIERESLSQQGIVSNREVWH